MQNLLEDRLQGMRVDVVMDEFFTDAGATKVVLAVDVVGGTAFADRG